MELKDQTHIRCTVVRKNGYCPVFKAGDQIHIKKHCLDVSTGCLGKYCYYTIADLFPRIMEMRKKPIGSKELFRCKDNGFIEIEIERMNDEMYDYENEGIE